MRHPGRPSKFGPNTARAILAALRRGCRRAAAARAAGVVPSTLASWIERGHAGEPGFRSFLTRVERAERDCWEQRRDAAERVRRAQG
jgi:transposase-like protein